MELIKNWENTNKLVFGEGDAEFIRENDYVRVTNRTEMYSSLAVHAKEILGEKQAYKSRYLMKLPAGSAPIKIKGYHKLHIDYLDVAEYNYSDSEEVVVTDSQWSEIKCTSTVPFGSKLYDCIIYFIQQGGACTDILIKEFEIDEGDPEKELERTRNIPRISEQKKRLVGTIRWDAFTKSFPEGIRPTDQVARVLSHKEYHNQAPFFSCVDGEKISFPEYTLETWEKEAEYARKGGLDYFAYLWYDTLKEMSEPRKLHLKSPNKDKILMCGVLEGLRSEKTMSGLFEAMKDSCYLRLDMRPVIFLYGIDKWSVETVEKLCQMAENAGVKEPLYIVGMSSVKNQFAFMKNFAKGIDAISWYSISAWQKDLSFEMLKDYCEDLMVKAGKFCKGNNIDIIPAFTTGRDTRARIRTGVSWCAGDPDAKEDKLKPYGNCYALPPTDEELKAHIKTTIKYVDENRDRTRPNLVCSYGWNEHEEGGWLCPTLSVDKYNNVIYDENGEIVPDTSRIDILASVLDELK